MRARRRVKTACLLGTALSFTTPPLATYAWASPFPPHDAALPRSSEIGPSADSANPDSGPVEKVAQRGRRAATRAYIAAGISCVPYARQVSGIHLIGNAWQWWDNASGQYARGYRAEPGSVLAFRSNSRMHLGHVSTVTRVVNAREVIVDHANWPSNSMRGPVMHDVAIVDVSQANNWSAVRVELAGRKGEFGSVYPTYGFIYNRPDTGTVVASIEVPAPQPNINPVTSDLRPVAERPWRTLEEMSESPDTPRRRIDLNVNRKLVGLWH